MQRNFTNDDFEDFLKRNAEDMKMYPSDAVWKSISKDLNKRRRIFGFSLTALVVSVSLLGYHIINSARSLPETFKALTTAEAGTANLPLKEGTTASNTNKLSIASINNNNINIAKKEADKDAVTNKKNTKANLKPVVTQQPPATLEFEQPVIIAYNPERFEKKAEKIQTQEPDIQHLNENPKPSIVKNNLSQEEIEEALGKIKKNKTNKLDLQLYFTPTVSYRKLTENKSYLNSAPQPNAPGNLAVLYNVNNMVMHKPNIGLELGYTAKYHIDKNIKLRGGLQFNINRYDIKAFYNSTELATIALNNSGTPVNTTTNYRSYGSNENTNWLENMYFQASVPLGAEVKLYSNNNVQFGIASTVQPTYILGDRAYVISSDYKNYVDVPWLIRRWNVNTALETFVGYSTGKLNWQVGPQVRYQMFSSFIDKYPVKENLFDFGLKVGVSLNK